MMDARELLEFVLDVLQPVGRAIENLTRIVECEFDQLESELGSDWERFLDDHPELGELDSKPIRTATPETKTPHPSTIARLEFDDDAVIAAVAGAVAEWRAYYEGKGWSPAERNVGASDVAAVLAGIPVDDYKTRQRLSHSDCVRVGQALGKLARAGRLKRIVEPRCGPRYLPT